MLERAGDPASGIIRISGLAWALAVDRTLRTLAAEPEVDVAGYERSAPARALGALDPADTGRLAAELAAAGISGADGAIREPWLLAVMIAVSAPVRVSAVARTGECSVHTDLGLAGGRGVAVAYRRRVRTPEGPETSPVDVVGVDDAVEVALFEEQDAWAAVRRILPEVPGLRAAAGATRPTGLPAGGRRRLDPRDLQGTGGAAVPQDLRDAVLAPRCTVHLQVSAGPAPLVGAASGAAAYSSGDVWALADRLYSVRTTGGDHALVLEDVPPGDIATTLQWRLLGAREFLATSAGQVA
ncbi:hypothetical protein ACTWLI_02820 [Arthrobacter sp. Hor0625]|uniref:hypothetical protein n=1 Tax=Arthrobacter sp. Hor0625 TaxID=3457358 RepID=UPI00403E4051